MKNKVVSVFILILICQITLVANQTTENNNIEIDSDEMVMKMKKFLDVYTEQLKKNQNKKEAYKLIIPAEDDHKSITTYTENFDLKSFKEEIESFIETLNKIRENNLKTSREEKQNVEEKNIDLSTKFKILTNRMNIAKNDFSKIKNDFNSKYRNKVYLISENRNLQSKNKKSIEDVKKKNDKLYDNLRKLDKDLLKLNVTENIWETDLKNSDEMTKLEIKNFNIQNNIDSLKDRFVSDEKFNFYFENLKSLIGKNLNVSNYKNKKIQDNLINKQIKLENLKKNIKFKYETYDNLNKTFSKLKDIKHEYNGVLLKLEETINELKSKKRIIVDNINEKKKQLKIKERTISTVLDNFEKQLENVDLNKIKFEFDQKEIRETKNRIKLLLEKENLIFKNQKIK